MLRLSTPLSVRSCARLSGRTILLLAGLALFFPACSRQKTASAPTAAVPPRRAVQAVSSILTPQQVGNSFERPPWIAHVNAVDLDQDGRTDILFCEAQNNEVRWLRQTAPGVFEESLLAKDMKAPVHVEAADMDGDGDLDVLVGSMSVVFPHNDRIGTVFVLENDGHQNFTPHVVLENTSRVTDVRAADLNDDGKMDLALAQFGYDQGEVSWLERTGPWEFRRHVLLDLSGAINVGIADFNGDHRPDIVALMSQQWEEVHYFQNEGGGRFTASRVWGSTNEDYGSSGLIVSDLNRDGRPDVVFTNGDGFGPAATPGPRPWHGVQWLENTTTGGFRHHRIGNLPGAYSPQAVDLDGDGDIDVVTVAAYADWNNRNRDVISLVWFRNDGKMNFEPVILARTPKDLITLTVGDFDGTGRPSLATGGFYIYPPFDALSRVTVWRRATKP